MKSILETALAYLANGYTPLWVEPHSKAAKTPGWQSMVATEESVRRQFARPGNLGVRTGDSHPDGTCLIAIDIDREEGELVRCVEQAIGCAVPCKRGKKGYTYLVRCSTIIKAQKVHWYRDGKKQPAIDVLGRGSQTVVPDSIHPEIKLPYRWVAGSRLETVPYDQLPVVNETVIDEIRGFCRKADDPIYALNDMVWAGNGGGGDTHETCLVAVASMVARGWPDEDIHAHISRAKRDACENAGTGYDWPSEQKVIQGWIDSARAKFVPAAGGKRRLSHGALADDFLLQTQLSIRFDRDRNCWFFFDGSYWLADQNYRVRHAVEQYLPLDLRNRATVEGVERSLRDRPELSISQDAWDPDKHLFHTPAGTIDLRSGELRSPRAQDLITRCAAVAPEQSCEGALWLDKQREWFGDDPSELEYHQRLAGYFLTGETRDACLPIWIGPGGDGKSVIANTYRYILGPYARTSTDTAFVETRHAQHSEEIACLRTARLVLVNEISGTSRWHDGRVKAVTGGESLSASFKGARVFEYSPEFKLLVTGNEAPSLRSVGPEFRRRFHVYPFTRGVQNPDRHLTEKFRQEAGAILRWMIDGAVRYYREGLPRSAVVDAANREYFDENDVIQQWLDENTEAEDGFRSEAKEMYDDFSAWYAQAGYRFPITRTAFTKRLKAKGIISTTATIEKGANSVRVYVGIRFNSNRQRQRDF